jgi:hypothetical protein
MENTNRSVFALNGISGMLIAVRLIFQFPHLHFHLYGHALSIKHPKLRAYLQYHYPEHFI